MDSEDVSILRRGCGYLHTSKSDLILMSEATGHHKRPAESYVSEILDVAKVGKIPETAKQFRE